MNLFTQAQLDLLIGYRRSQLTDVSATTLLWYDYFLTFNAERRYYWGTRWSWSRFAFTGNRYLALLLSILNMEGIVSTMISHRLYVLSRSRLIPFSHSTASLSFYCTFYSIYLVALAGPLQILLVELIVTIRLYAIFGKSIKVLRWILGLLFCTTAASCTIVILEYAGDTAETNTIPGAVSCFAVGKSLSFLWAYWIPVAIFESTAFILSLYKTREHIREMEVLSPYVESGKSLGSRLMEALFRDSLLYFAAMATIVLTGAFLIRFGSDQLGVRQIIAGPFQSLLAIMGSRLLLSTHEVVMTTFHPASTTSGQPLGDIELADMSRSGSGSGSGNRSGGDTGLHLDTLASVAMDLAPTSHWEAEHDL